MGVSLEEELVIFNKIKRVSIEVAWRIFPVGYLGLINRDYIAFLLLIGVFHPSLYINKELLV